MAFLRRGLVTNKGAVPSVHTRPFAAPTFTETRNQLVSLNTREAQPAVVIKGVTKVIKMALSQNDYHLVQLTCGHQARSKSTFQGYCRSCQH